MKRISKLMSVFCVLFVVFIFAGCSIEAPTLSRDGCLVSWNWVKNASSYEVEINGEVYTTTKNSYNLAPVIQKSLEPQTVRVKALTKNFFLRGSAYSDSVIVSVGDTRLDTPQNFAVVITESSYLCSWDAVFNANAYCIRMYNKEKDYEFFYFTDSTSCNLYGQVSVAGEFEVAVFAYTNDSGLISRYGPSEYSASQSFVIDVMLEAPSDVEIVNTGGKLYCKWPTIDEADTYNVSILNGKTFSVKNVEGQQFQMFNLTEQGISVGKGGAIFVSVGAVGAENSGYNDSPYTDITAYYDTEGKRDDFAKVKYNFVGTEFDLVADSYEELQTITWFMLYYRVTDIKLFFNYSLVTSKPSDDFKLCVNDYQEIKHVSYSFSALSDGSYSSAITYIHPMYPTLTTAQTSIQSQAVKPNSFATEANQRSSDFDEFKIENRTQTAMVYNSDQLYYAVQNGCKPIFPDQINPAYLAYVEAKNILREIVSDDMDDYSKVLAIFDWMCYNTHYDHELVTINNKISSNKMSGNIAEYRGFYIEGVFFDKGQVVCDGMSKAFALLCGIENIDCYKVTGVSNTTTNKTNTADHAWNKVKLDINEDGTGEWYVVDVTQNDFSESVYNGYTTEYLTHSFFLRSDEWSSNVYYHQELSPNKDVASDTSFDYYTTTTYDGENDILIQSYSELLQLAQYVKSKLKYIEFAVDYSKYKCDEYSIKMNFGFPTANVVSPRSIENEAGTAYHVYIIYYS